MSHQHSSAQPPDSDLYSADDIYGDQGLAATFVPADRLGTVAHSRGTREIYAWLKLLERDIAHLLSSEKDPVLWRHSEIGTALVLNPVGKMLASHIQRYPEFTLEGKKLSLRIDLFRDVIANLGGKEVFETLPGHHQYEPGALDAPSFIPKCRAGFVLRALRDQRKIGNSRRFETQLEEAQARSDDIFAKMVAVIRNLFLVCANLLAVRVDFEYRVDARQHVTIKSAKRDLRKFLNHIRHQSQFRDLLGYIWVAEEGVFGGIHFHCFFFFHGNNAQRDIFLSLALGKYWVNITQGRGTFHSCNAKKGSYRYLGIGKVSHADLEKHAGMYLILKYFAETDKAQSIPGERSYGFSKPITPTSKSAGGRLRKLSGFSVFTAPPTNETGGGDEA